MKRFREFTPDAHRHKDCSHELKYGEVWISNVDVQKGAEIPQQYKGLKTARLGEQAYDIHGKPISRFYMRPLILHKSEEDEYNRIYMERMRE